MKQVLSVAVGLVLSFPGVAQTDMLEKIGDLEARLKVVEAKVAEQTERNAFLKEALDLRTTPLERTVDGIRMQITKVYMNAGEQQLYVQGLVTYLGDNEKKNLQFGGSQEIVDPQGNFYQTFGVGYANNKGQDFAVSRAEAGIPYGFLAKFGNITERIPTIALLTLRMFNDRAGEIDFKFKGLEVSWLAAIDEDAQPQTSSTRKPQSYRDRASQLMEDIMERANEIPWAVE